MKKQLLSFIISIITISVYSQSIVVNDINDPESSLTAEELIQEVLVNGDSCVDITLTNLAENPDGVGNITEQSWGYFRNNGTNFPFEEGIILSSGFAVSAEGPNDDDATSNGDMTWPGDSDIEAILDNFTGTNVDTNNATVFEFTFSSALDQIGFEFIFASEEYEFDFECDDDFRDGFAFLVSGPGIPDTSGAPFGGQNIASIVGSNNIPVSTLSIHDDSFICDSEQNGVDFFPELYVSNVGGNNTNEIQFDGRTVALNTATIDIIPTETYTVKLVIADRGDTGFDSAVFLNSGSFNVGTIDLGEDISILNGNAVCEDDIITLDADTPNAVSYTWFMDGVEIIGETDPTLEVTLPGVYSVEVVLNIGCVAQDEISVEFIDSTSVNIDDIDACENDDLLLDTGISDTLATFSWFLNGVTLINETGPTLNVTTSGEYSVVVNFNSGCVFSDTATVTITTLPIIELGDTINSCLENPVTLDATPTNVDLADVSFEWFLNSNVLIGETNPTLDVTQEGTYQVIVTSGPCVVVDTVIVAPLDILFDLGDDFNTCFDNPVTLDATPSNVDPLQATYEWSLNGTVITGEENPMLVITEEGTYDVTVTLGICSNTDTITVTQANPDGSPCNIDPDCIVIDFLEDFGTGTERTQTPFTQYIFNPGPGEVNDGEYAIINTSAELNVGWHDNLEDNTLGDVDGRALFVNADFNTDEFYRRTVNDLLPDTEYTFSSFITTVYDTDTNICPNNGIPANVTFRVEDLMGVTLAEIDTGDIPNEADPNWQEFTIDFNSAMNTSVQIVLVNNSIGGCGNDLAIDDISLLFSGDVPQIVTPADLELCDDLGDMVEIFDLTSQITAILNGEDPTGFNITFHTDQLDAETNVNAITTPNAYANTANPETIYVRVERVLDTNCFSVIDFDLILNQVFSLANNLPAIIEICSTDTIPVLDATPIDPLVDLSSVTYVWTDASNTIVSNAAQFTPTVAGLYTVVVDLLPCSQETFTVDLTINQVPTLDLGPDESLCNDTPFEIIPITGGDLTGATFLWSTGETTNTIVIDEPGIYDLTITVGPCTVTDSIMITVAQPVDVSLGDDFTTCREFPNTLTAVTGDPNVTFEWFLNGDLITGETSSTLDFVIPETAVGTQEYTVVLTSSQGCTSSDTIEVSAFDIGDCVISQGLSPDDSPGFNDTLDLEFLAARTGIEVLHIYNRLGTLVFEQDNYVNQWRGQTDNGNDLPTGTYFYVLSLEGEDPVYGRQATGWIYINRGE